MDEKIYFNNNNGDKLSAILSVPEDNSTKSIAILCHGLNSGKDSKTYSALNNILLNNNIATFRFDFYAHGESEGKIEDRSLEEFVEDVLKAIEYVKDKGYNNIGICGTSFGGVASVVAASKNNNIKTLVLKSTGMGQTSRKMSNYIKHFESKSWIKAGEKINIPTLILHGTHDTDVEIELAEELHKAIKTSKLNIYNEADHRFTKQEDFDKSIKEISEFIIKNI